MTRHLRTGLVAVSIIALLLSVSPEVFAGPRANRQARQAKQQTNRAARQQTRQTSTETRRESAQSRSSSSRSSARNVPVSTRSESARRSSSSRPATSRSTQTRSSRTVPGRDYTYQEARANRAAAQRAAQEARQSNRQARTEVRSAPTSRQSTADRTSREVSPRVVEVPQSRAVVSSNGDASSRTSRRVPGRDYTFAEARANRAAAQLAAQQARQEQRQSRRSDEPSLANRSGIAPRAVQRTVEPRTVLTDSPPKYATPPSRADRTVPGRDYTYREARDNRAAAKQEAVETRQENRLARRNDEPVLAERSLRTASAAELPVASRSVVTDSAPRFAAAPPKAGGRLVPGKDYTYAEARANRTETRQDNRQARVATQQFNTQNRVATRQFNTQARVETRQINRQARRERYAATPYKHHGGHYNHHGHRGHYDHHDDHLSIFLGVYGGYSYYDPYYYDPYYYKPCPTPVTVVTRNTYIDRYEYVEPRDTYHDDFYPEKELYDDHDQYEYDDSGSYHGGTYESASDRTVIRRTTTYRYSYPYYSYYFDYGYPYCYDPYAYWPRTYRYRPNYSVFGIHYGYRGSHWRGHYGYHSGYGSHLGLGVRINF